MKKLKLILLIITLGYASTSDAQFLKKLGKRATKAAEETVIRKVEEKTARKTGKTMDTVLDSDNKIKKKSKRKSKKKKKGSKVIGNNETADNSPEVFNANTNFDFVAGNKILLFDDFSVDNIGDFPSKWDTNGSGEIVSIKNKKWLKLMDNSVYVPDVSVPLPENYTIEFDMLTNGIDKKTSSQAKLEIWLHDNNSFKKSKNKAAVEIPLCQFIVQGFIVEKTSNGEREFRNSVMKDVRAVILQKTHISIAVNGKRFRMWLNQDKIIDVPRLVPANIRNFKIHPRDLRGGIDEVFVSNFKIAKGELDVRSLLLKNGSFSTTGILFNAGSAAIKPESYGVLKQIADAMKQEPSLKLNIIGHTDSDGGSETNLSLSQDRALAVKNNLVSQFSIQQSRLQTQGKGESKPVESNTTSEGKAKNRRVEFIKL